MSRITFHQRGNLRKTNSFFERCLELMHLGIFDHYGVMGVKALEAATPVDSGVTANSWAYVIDRSSDHTSIQWVNNNINNYVNIAIILQYGHGTGTGGYVQGRDYINPAIRPVFDQMSEALWKEVIRR